MEQLGSRVADRADIGTEPACCSAEEAFWYINVRDMSTEKGDDQPAGGLDIVAGKAAGWSGTF